MQKKQIMKWKRKLKQLKYLNVHFCFGVITKFDAQENNYFFYLGWRYAKN